jgi:hypothetical protein
VQSDWNRSKKIAIVIGILGIAIEAVTVMLLASKRIPSAYGTPLVVTGMLLAFVPIFLMARRHRRR